MKTLALTIVAALALTVPTALGQWDPTLLASGGGQPFGGGSLVLPIGGAPWWITPVPNDTYIVNVDGDATSDFVLEMYVDDGNDNTVDEIETIPVSVAPGGVFTDDSIRNLIRAFIPHRNHFGATKAGNPIPVGDTTLIFDLKRRSKIQNIWIDVTDPNVTVEVVRFEPFDWTVAPMELFVVDVDPSGLSGDRERPDMPESTAAGGASVDFGAYWSCCWVSWSNLTTSTMTDKTFPTLHVSAYPKHVPAFVGTADVYFENYSQHGHEVSTTDPGMNVSTLLHNFTLN